MTISSNNLGIPQFDGMKENDIFINTSSSQGKQVSGTDNLNISDLKEIPSREDSIRMYDQTHPVTNDDIQHAAQPGKGGFFNAIKNFFMGIFTKSQPEVQMPGTVMVTVAGENIKVNGERFRGMIEALPMGERDEALQHLENRITDRIHEGELIFNEIFTADKMKPARPQDVSDLMLFIQLRHVALHPKESFTNGAYSIEDPEGKLADYLDSCKEGYNRSSSHLEGLQNAPLADGKSNAMRGIDIPGGLTTGLLDKRGTIHYGSIPKQEHVEDSKQRLFIKTERNGCRLSLRSFKFWTKSFWVNTSGRAHRAMQFSDIGRAIKHARNYFEKSDEKSGGNYRSEKLRGLSPKDIAETLKGLSVCKELEDLKPYFNKADCRRLPENARLSQTLNWLDAFEEKVRECQMRETRRMEDFEKFNSVLESIKSTLIHGMYTDNPDNVKRTTERSFIWFLSSDKLDHIDRLGNEVMMNLDDFKSAGQ